MVCNLILFIAFLFFVCHLVLHRVAVAYKPTFIQISDPNFLKQVYVPYIEGKFGF